MGKYIQATTKYTTVFFKVLSLSTVFLVKVLSHICMFILQVLNIVPNIQWKKDLNVFQNLIYNLYIPSSLGVPSMHSSLLTFAIIALALSFMSEIYRFYINPEFNFSVGFYTNIGALGGLIITAFSLKEYKQGKEKKIQADKPVEPSGETPVEGESSGEVQPVEQPAAPPISISKGTETEAGEKIDVPKKKTRRSKRSLIS